jgi:hypothetical protein
VGILTAAYVGRSLLVPGVLHEVIIVRHDCDVEEDGLRAFELSRESTRREAEDMVMSG